jgi:hypothetical protein
MLRGTRVERFLAACGVDDPRIAAVLAEAQDLAARAGTAVVEVRTDEGVADVRVLAATPPALIVGRPDAPPALAAAG